MNRLLLLWMMLIMLLAHCGQAAAQIRYAPNPRFAPVDYLDNRGQHKGIMAGYMRLIQERADTPFQYVRYAVWDQIIKGLESNEIDIVAGIHFNEARNKYAFFTERLFELPLFLVVKRGNAWTDKALAGKKLAGVRGYASTEYIQNTYPEAQLLLFDSELEALMQTSAGQTDATVTDLAAASALIEMYGLSNLMIGQMLDFNWDIRIAVSRSQPEIFALLTKALATISQAERDSLYRAHIGMSSLEYPSIWIRFRDEYIMALWILAVVALGTTVFFVVLRRKIKTKTKLLRLQTERYQWATRAASDAIFEIDGYTGIIHFEENFRELFGYDLSQKQNTIQHWWRYVHPDDLLPFQHAIKTALRERQFFMTCQFRLLKVDGKYAQVEARSYLMTDEKGKVSKVIGALQDITRINQHLEAISKQNERLREIAWMQSHVIRAPLSRLMSLVMLLELEGTEGELDKKNIHQLIQQSARELDQVLQDIVSKSSEIKSENDEQITS